MKPYLPIVLIAAALLPTLTQAQVYKFEVSLDGGQEIPGPGDPDGTGWAVLYIDAAANTITWDISVADILLPIAADHIHQAPAGVAGPVVVHFGGSLSGGPMFDADLAAVLADPTGFYVNVHNADYPGGAVRGQIGTGVIVPEASPLSAGLALAGLGMLGCWRRRRQMVRG